MRQVVAIHGGDAFATYEEYIEFLKDHQIDDPTLPKGMRWKEGLQETLGAAYQVILPRMPNSFNARYAEWKLWFEKFIPYLNDDVTFIGHSLGGIFLVKYLSEEIFPKKIAATLLVAAPYNTATEHPLVDFNIVQPLDRLTAQGGQIYLYQSKDDQSVPFSNYERYAKELPQAISRTFSDRGHFNIPNFPEIVADIKSLG